MEIVEINKNGKNSTITVKDADGTIVTRGLYASKHRTSFNLFGITYTMGEDGSWTASDNSIIVMAQDMKINDNLPMQRKSIAIEMQDKLKHFTTDQKFSFLERFVTMVIKKITPSAIILGPGGFGKTHTVLKMLAEHGMKRGEDYIIQKGYSTAKAMYITLHNNRNKTIVFDDCDSILKDPTAIAILKAALDSYEQRIISWGSYDPNSTIEPEFEFTGQIIFISNLPDKKFDKALKTRALRVDVSMSKDEILERIRSQMLNEFFMPDFSEESKIAAMEFMETNKKFIEHPNFRLFQMLIKLVAASDDDSWKDAALYLIANDVSED